MFKDFILKTFGLVAQPSQTPIPQNEKNNQDKEEQMFKKYGPKEILFEWTSQGKIQNIKLSPRYTRLFMIIGFVICLIFALMQDFFIIIVIGTIVFFYYVLHNKYEAPLVSYKISNYGFIYGTRTYYWDELKSFFFSSRSFGEVLVIDTTDSIIPRIIALFSPEDRENIFNILKDHILYLDKEPKGTVEKGLDSLADKFMFEDK